MIEIKNVSKWYGPVPVLNDCSVSINKGDVVVICGPSDSGKSTLIKTVNGLEHFQKGNNTRPENARPRGPDGAKGQVPRPALGRPAAARGDCAGAVDGPDGHA